MKTPALVVIGGWGYGADALSAFRRTLATRVSAEVVPFDELYRENAGSGLEAFVGGAVDLLDRIAAPVTLAGWSLGGQIALATALRRPTWVKRLALIASTPRFIRDETWPAGVPESECRALRTALRRHPNPALRAFHARAAAPDLPKGGPWLTPPVPVLLEGLSALETADLRTDIGVVPFELDLVHGDADRIIPCAASEWMRKQAPRATFRCLSGAGHDLPLSHPDEIADWLCPSGERNAARLSLASGTDSPVASVRSPGRDPADRHRASVRARFCRAASTYDDGAEVQRKAAGGLLAFLPNGLEPPRRIVDAGCGTGLLTRGLANRFPRAEIQAVDFSESMLGVAKSRPGAEHITWIASDLLVWSPEYSVDMVASSSALHWIRPMGRVVSRIRAWLRPGGCLAAAIMVRGTLGELHALRREIAPHKPPASSLPTQDEIRETLRGNGFFDIRIQVQTWTIRFPSAQAMLDRLREQGLTGGELSRGAAPLVRGEISRLRCAYDERHRVPRGGVAAGYTIAFVFAR